VYLLDTNTVSFALLGRAPKVSDRLLATPKAEVAISIITAMELRFGLAKNPAAQLRGAVEAFLDTMPVLPLDRSAEAFYGEIRAALERAGRAIGPLDTIIAAQARSLGATLVTNNVREFRRVHGLDCTDWM
jgi:tRNA(fMet)-specific endonuclease VapC